MSSSLAATSRRLATRWGPLTRKPFWAERPFYQVGKRVFFEPDWTALHGFLTFCICIIKSNFLTGTVVGPKNVGRHMALTRECVMSRKCIFVVHKKSFLATLCQT
jgi:hypothetical protein